MFTLISLSSAVVVVTKRAIGHLPYAELPCLLLLPITRRQDRAILELNPLALSGRGPRMNFLIIRCAPAKLHSRLRRYFWVLWGAGDKQETQNGPEVGAIFVARRHEATPH